MHIMCCICGLSVSFYIKAVKLVIHTWFIFCSQAAKEKHSSEETDWTVSPLELRQEYYESVGLNWMKGVFCKVLWQVWRTLLGKLLQKWPDGSGCVELWSHQISLSCLFELYFCCIVIEFNWVPKNGWTLFPIS